MNGDQRRLGLSRIPQLNMSEGRTLRLRSGHASSGEDTQGCCFKVFSTAWHNALFSFAEYLAACCEDEGEENPP